MLACAAPSAPSNVLPDSLVCLTCALQNQAADELANRGGAMATQAIDMYVAQDAWDKVRVDWGRLLWPQPPCFPHLLTLLSSPRMSTSAAPSLNLAALLGSCAQVHEIAERQGPEVAAMYAARHAERRFKQGDYGAAAAVFAAHGVSASPQYHQLYRDIAQGILTSPYNERSAEGEQVGLPESAAACINPATQFLLPVPAEPSTDAI